VGCPPSRPRASPGPVLRRREQSIELKHKHDPRADPPAGIATGASAEGQGCWLNNSHAQAHDARTTQDGPRRYQRGNTQETCPALTGERNTSREMDAQQCTRGYGGFWPAAPLRKLPVPGPHPLGDADKAVARTVAPTRIPRAWRTRNSLASQRRQVDQGRRDQSQIQPEPTTRHRVTSVFALISGCQFIVPAFAIRAGREVRSRPITPPRRQAVES